VCKNYPFRWTPSDDTGKSSGSQTSSGSRPRPPPLPNAPPSNTDIALHNIGTNRGPSHARYNIRYQCLSSQGARDPRVRRPGVSVPCAPSPEFLVLTVIEESFEPIRFKTITKRCIPIIKRTRLDGRFKI